MKITLIEGSVRVTSAANNSVTLKPGQQSQLKKDGSLSLVKDVDIDGVTAWKDGKFMFDGKTDIGTIMRQIARWYDLEVDYEGQIKSHFSGSISRSANLSQVLKKIETTGMINFQVEGKKVIVKP
jgi:ferric-dicitrate binding protein FerR (iron transport regulator)